MVIAQERTGAIATSLSNTHSPEQHHVWAIAFGVCALTLLSHLGIGLWGLALFHQAPQRATLLLIVVLAGMIYDNAVLLIGCYVKQSPLLERLNYLRYAIHNLCVPLLVIVGFDFLGYTNTTWVNSPIANCCFGAVTLGLIALGIKDCISLELTAERVAGILYYKPKQKSLPIPTILTSLIMAGIGCYLWAQLHWAWVLIGTLTMILGNAVHAESLRKSVSPIVECGFMVTLFATASQVL